MHSRQLLTILAAYTYYFSTKKKKVLNRQNIVKIYGSCDLKTTMCHKECTSAYRVAMIYHHGKNSLFEKQCYQQIL